MAVDVQPIITGIQAVGSVSIKYRYNTSDGVLKFNSSVFGISDGSKTVESIPTLGSGDGVECTGFRLDSQFLDANPQLASSFMIPMLGGGAIALTNNNRSGTLSINTTKVSLPDAGNDGSIPNINTSSDGYQATGVQGTGKYYDLTTLLQAQQSVSGGDSVGSTLTIRFSFGGKSVTFQFLGCTVASIKPLALSGNDAVDYGAAINYLNWTVNYGSESAL